MSLVAWYAGLGLAQTAVALLLVVVRPRKILHWVVAAHLILWAGSGVVFQLMREAAVGSSARLLYHRVASYYEIPTSLLVLLIIDQLMLRRPRPLWRSALLAGVAAHVAVAILTTYALGPDSIQNSLASTLTFGAQLAAVLVAVREVGRPARSVLERRQIALVGLAFVLLVGHNAGGALALLGTTPSRLFVPVSPNDFLGPLRHAAILVAAPVLLVCAPRLASPFRSAGRTAYLVAFLLPFALGGIARFAPGLFGPFGSRVVVVTAFFLALSIALLRYDVGTSGAQRERLLRSTAGAVLAFAAVSIAAGALLAVRGDAPTSLGLALALAFLLLGVLAIPLRDIIERLARRILADPLDPDVLRERVRLYATTLDAALAPDGRLRAGAEPALAALRAELGIAERDHAILLADAAERPERRRLVAYRLALGEMDPSVRPADAARLAALRRELAISDEEHALLAAEHDGRPGAAAGPGALVAGRYRVQRHLGRGAFGEVVLARDEARARDVVLKRLPPERARDARALRGFHREMRLAGSLAHPRIVAVHDVAREGDHTYLVMEHVPGGSLADRLHARGPLAEEEAVRVALDVLDALDALHREGIVHRDVKPANVLLDADGRAKLADFSLAREVVSGETLGGAPVGTPAFMSPEQARGLPATAASDLYGAGATLYAALAGRSPIDVEGLNAFEAAMRVVQAEPALPLGDASPGVNEALDVALAKDPARRFASAEDMSQALRAPAPAARR